MGYVPRLQEHYSSVREQLAKELGLANANEIPRIEKIVVNIGQGEAVQNHKILEGAIADLEKITGQKAVLTRAKKSIAGFKLRAGVPIGCSVTLRRQRMYEFLDRLINVSIPRIRDFRGFSPKAFDGRGNYSLGIKEQIVFPEIEFDKIDVLRGMDICITTTAKSDDEARALLKAFGFPFKE